MNKINKKGFDNWVIDNLKSDAELTKKYLAETITQFEEDNDISALLSSLSKAAKAKGWTYLEQETGISRQALYNALSEEGNPRIKTFLTIVNALGYQLKLKKLKTPKS